MRIAPLDTASHHADRRDRQPNRREKRIMREKRLTLATWIAIGAGVGVALGVAMDNLAL